MFINRTIKSVKFAMVDDYDNYEGSRYDLYDKFQLVYDKIDKGETYIYYSYWKD